MGLGNPLCRAREPLIGSWRRFTVVEKLPEFLPDFRTLAAPYGSAEGRCPAGALFLAVIGLNLGQVYVLVLLNGWYQQFYDVLQNPDREAFGPLTPRSGVLAPFFTATA